MGLSSQMQARKEKMSVRLGRERCKSVTFNPNPDVLNFEIAEKHNLRSWKKFRMRREKSREKRRLKRQLRRSMKAYQRMKCNKLVDKIISESQLSSCPIPINETQAKELDSLRCT